MKAGRGIGGNCTDRHPPFTPTDTRISGQRAPVRWPPKVAHLPQSPIRRKRRHGKRAPRKLGDFDHAVGHAVSGRFLREKWVSVFPRNVAASCAQLAARRRLDRANRSTSHVK